MSDGGHTSREGGAASDLDALRSRLDQLHRSVESLGQEPTAPPAQGAYGQPAAPPPPQSPPPAPASPYAEQSVPQQPAPTTPYDYSADPVYADPYARPAADPWAAPPAAGNGESAEQAYVPPANVAILDVGPFADLVELRHFEEALGRLETVRDVHVRRFGHNRAKVEVGMVGAQLIERELYRLGRPMEIEPGPDGEVVVEFTGIVTEEAPPEEAPDRPVAAPVATAMPTATAGEAEGAESDGPADESGGERAEEERK